MQLTPQVTGVMAISSKKKPCLYNVLLYLLEKVFRTGKKIEKRKEKKSVSMMTSKQKQITQPVLP